MALVGARALVHRLLYPFDAEVWTSRETPIIDSSQGSTSIATEPPSPQANVSITSYSSNSTHGAQAFVAITTDANDLPVVAEAAVNTITDISRDSPQPVKDFQELTRAFDSKPCNLKKCVNYSRA